MKFAQMIITVRQTLGLSQVDFARMLNVSRAQLSMAELGKRELRPSKLVVIVQILNILTPATDKPSVNNAIAINKEDLRKQLVRLNYQALQINDKLQKRNDEKDLPRQEFTVDLEVIKEMKLIEDVWLDYIKIQQKKRKPKAIAVNENDLRMQLVALEAQIKFLEEIMSKSE